MSEPINQENFLAVREQGERQPVAFRDDLREPAIQFGRCSITGDWGKVVAVDMGDIAIECPVIDEGVEYDPDSKEVTFTRWRPAIFSSQATFSAEGLRHLLGWMDGKESPVPSIEPVLLYKWVIQYKDGDVLCQFMADEHDAGKELEINSREIQWERGVQQVSVIPRFTNEQELPNFTFVPETGKFYKSGEELDVDYSAPLHPEAQIVYCRKVSHTFASGIGTGLARTLQSAQTTVLQLIGWHVDGVPGMESTNQNPCCVIAIDDRGNWRPWKQNV